MYGAIEGITHRRFANGEDPDDWWRTGTEETPRKFATLLAQWKAQATGPEVPLWTVDTVYLSNYNEVSSRRPTLTPAGQTYKAIEDLGIAILPQLAEQFRQGNYTFADMAFELTGNAPPLPKFWTISAELKAKSFLAWWEAHKAQWTIPWPTTAG